MGSAPPPFTFRFEPYNDHLWVSGAGDSGKTKLVQYLLIPLFLRHGLFFVVYDYNHQYGHLGVPVTSSFDYLTRFCMARKPIIFQSLTNSDKDFERFCLICARFQRIIIIFEEFHEFLRSKLSMPPYVSAIIKTGRNWKRTYVIVTQRPQEVPTSPFSNAKHKFVFKVDFSVESDRAWLEGAIGKAKAAELEAAPNHSFMYKERNGAAVLRPPIPDTWTKNPCII